MFRQLLALFIIMAAATAASAATLSISGPPEPLPEADPAETLSLTLTVSAEEMSDVAAFEAHVAIEDEGGQDASSLFALTQRLLATAWSDLAGDEDTLDKDFDDGIGSLLPAGCVASNSADLAELTFEYGEGTNGTFTFRLLGTSALFDADTSYCVSGEPAGPCTVIIGQPGVEGDVDGNGCVNILDMMIVRNNLGAPPPIDPPEADVNDDGACNILDMMMVRNHLGDGCGD